jgi:hypothetical protein
MVGGVLTLRIWLVVKKYMNDEIRKNYIIHI